MSKKKFSSYRLFTYMIIGIFAIEFAIMFTLQYFNIFDTIFVGFLDSFILALTVSPFVYLFAVKPLQSKIEELEKAEAIVREYTIGIESERRAIFAALENSVIVSMTDDKGNITYVNQKFIEISKYTQEELIGQNHRILKSGDQTEDLFVDLWDTISHGKIWRGEIKNRAKDGSYYWVDAIIVPIFDENGKPKNYVSMRADITERKKTEKKIAQYLKNIEESKAKNDALLASIGEGMIITDEAGKVSKINQATEDLLGWNQGDLLGKFFNEAVQAIDEKDKEIPLSKCAVMIAMTSRAPVTSDLIFYKRKNGTYLPVKATTTPVIIDGKIIGTIQIFRDMTKENELEKTRRDILSLASHQLRTPLSGTKWLIETLKRGIHGTLTKNQEQYLDQIYKINERMTSLVHDMLSVLQMEDDVAQAKKERVPLETLFRALSESTHDAAESRRVTLHFPKGDDSVVETDLILLRSILECLLSNAINYSKMDTEVIVNTERRPDEFVFIVKDSGIGIPEDEQQQIFNRFYRASNAKTFDTHGTGLGLYIAATLSKKIGASISFETKEGTGSTFYVHIPTRAPKELKNREEVSSQ